MAGQGRSPCGLGGYKGGHSSAENGPPLLCRAGAAKGLQAQGGEIERDAPLPRERARALERVGAVVVRAQGELGELPEQERLVARKRR